METISAVERRSTALTIAPYLPSDLPARDTLVRLIEAVVGIDRLRRSYDRLPPASDALMFVSQALRALEVSTQIEAEDLARVPRQGACIVVANHPHGGVDGLCLLSAVLGVRRDVKVLANPFLTGIAELRGLFLEVDPFGGAVARRRNGQGLLAARRWLDQGGMVVLFPAGEVSSLDLSARRVIDSVWHTGAARLMRRSGACVLPIHIGGRNSNLFQLSGMLHARLRTLLLVRELLGPKRLPIPIRIGRAIEAAQLGGAESDRQATAYLRFRTYALAERERGVARVPAQPMASVPDGEHPEVVAAWIARLPPQSLLLSSGRFDVLLVEPGPAQSLIGEIGRLREISFRAAGEGTGRATDVDAFDAYYDQLIVWDRAARRIAGGYRIGRVAPILERLGPRGLYVSSLFRLSPRLLAQLADGLELGRSFVRPEYQREYLPLLLLWKGIAHFVARHPQHRRLFGPVSISEDYHPVSRRILIQFLARHFLDDSRASDVKPRQPVKQCRRPDAVLDALDHPDSPLLADILREFESDGKGMPVLLRQYLKLGGRILGFNVDPAFSRVIDCLLLVDLQSAGEERLARYMGARNARAYFDRHGVVATSVGS